MSGRRIGRAALCLVALALVQCGRARTELVVTVRSELSWGVGRDLQSLVVTVRRGSVDGATRWQQTKLLGDQTGQWRLPLSFGLYPSDPSDFTPVWIEVLGCAARDGCVPSSAVVTQRAVATYRTEQTVGLDIWLAARCRGVMCSASQTCSRDTGMCVSARSRDLDVRPLPGGVVPSDNDVMIPPEDAVMPSDAPDVTIVDADVERPDAVIDVPIVDADAPSMDADVTVVDVVDAASDTPVVDTNDARPADVTSIDITAPDIGETEVFVADAPAMEDSFPIDASRDSSAFDVPADPVGMGVYEYMHVHPGTLVAPVAVAWHPSGSYALILSASNTVFRYDPAAMSVTQVATSAADVSWRAVSFVADGSRALLIGNTTSTSGGATSRRGRLWVWDHASSMLSERTSDQWTAGTYYALRWNRDGSRGALLGTATNLFTVWFYDAGGNRTGSPIAYGRMTGTGCNDVGWITERSGNPALAIVCGINTAEILTATNLSTTPTFTTIVGPGAVSNVGSIAVRPQGDVALIVDYNWKLGYYRDFRWTTGFGTPTLAGAAAVTFSTDGARALAYGGFGRLHEYRYDLYRASDIVDVSITNLSIAPFMQPSSTTLNAVAWRPGCEEGLAVGGANSISGTSAFVAMFRVVGGRRCL